MDLKINNMTLMDLSESTVKIVENKIDDLKNFGMLANTIISDTVETAITPIIQSSTTSNEGSSKNPHEIANSENSALKVDVNSEKNHDQEESVPHKQKKKKRNQKKFKSKGVISASQKESKCNIISQDPEPNITSEICKDIEGNQKHPETEITTDNSSIEAIHEERQADLSANQIQAPIICTDDAPTTEAFETKIMGPEFFEINPTNVEDVNVKSSLAESSILPSKTILITSENQQCGDLSNSDVPSGKSFSNLSTTNVKVQYESIASEDRESIKSLNESSKLKPYHPVKSSIDELVVGLNKNLDTEALNSSSLTNTNDTNTGSKPFESETASHFQKDENKVAFTPAKGESHSLVSEETSTEYLKSTTINEEESKVTVTSEDNTASPIKSNLASLSTVLTNSENEIVKGVDHTFSDIELRRLSQSNPESMHQLSSVKTNEGNDKTIGLSLRNSPEPADDDSEIIKLKNEIEPTTNSNLTVENPDINDELSEVKKFSDVLVSKNKDMTKETSDDNKEIKYAMHPEALASNAKTFVTSKTSVIYDLKETSDKLYGTLLNDKETLKDHKPPPVEEIITSFNCPPDFKKSSEITDFMTTNGKNNEYITHHFVKDHQCNFNESNITPSKENDSSTLTEDALTNGQYGKHSDPTHAAQVEASESLAASLHEKTEVENNNLSPNIQTKSKTNEYISVENWKDSLESTAENALSAIESKVTQVSNLIGILSHSISNSSCNETKKTIPPFSENDDQLNQTCIKHLKIEDSSYKDNLMHSIGSDFSGSKVKSEIVVDLDKEISEGKALLTPLITEIVGPSASQVEIANKNKLKFKHSLDEQALAPEIVTISKETLDLLYKKLHVMQLEIERLSSALKSQNEINRAFSQDTSNSSFRNNHEITESSNQSSKIMIREENLNVEPLKKPFQNKSSRNTSLWRFMSIFRYNSTTKLRTRLATRPKTETLPQSSLQLPKGKGKEINTQPKILTTRNCKIIGRVRAKDDFS
ncbi:hypothetical protein EV44_g1831 [Erysiphe necator]|uniref:Uncharacterized protein n=1 Tax=Uncinula necator TaxID=52586 RepID=A0A0B1PCL7_UNCNE|nr:hypothetical protein EV44_g1831 [Erysiphe necator]